MAAKSKKGGSGLLLLAGLGVGAFLLFNNKAAAAAIGPESHSGSSADEDIPAAPKILAVNNASTESPLPTGIVSDEDGMMPASSGTYSTPAAPVSSSDSWDDIPDAVQDKPTSAVPALVSTKLTEKEKTILQKGVLTDELAVKRPDLYKAIYVKKHGQNGKGQQALKAADSIIQNIKVKSAAKPRSAVAHQKKRKVALKLNTKIAPKRAAPRKTATGSKVAKAAAKPLVLVKRPAPKAAGTAVKTRPVHPKVAAKRPTGKVVHKPARKKTPTRPHR